MSKRHQSSRRRAYGRRQHELQERTDRRSVRGRPEPDREGGEAWDLEFAGTNFVRGRDAD